MTESVLRHEIAQEQGYVTMLYEVLDRARDRATAELKRVHGGATTGTDQAATERDSFAKTYAGRAEQLMTVERGLCFGRIDAKDRSRRSTSAVSGFSTTTTIRYSSIGERRWRNPSIGRRRSDPIGVFRRRHIRLSGRTVVAVDDDILDLAAVDDQDREELDRRGRAVRLAVGRPHRPDVGDRRHHPGGAGRDHPLGAARSPGGPGWPRHRQDRRRVAPRRVPALHPPRPARPARGAGGRPERDLPALHRAGAALARRDRGGAVHHRRVAPRGGRDRGRIPEAQPDQGQPPDGRGHRPRRPAPRARGQLRSTA